MKIIHHLILLASIAIFSFSFIPANNSDCAMAVTYAEMAYKNFKQGYQSNSMEDALPFIKKGVEQATETSAYAISPNCNCANAKNYALNAVTFGNKALKAGNFKDSRKFTKKAMNMSLDVMTAVPNCK